MPREEITPNPLRPPKQSFASAPSGALFFVCSYFQARSWGACSQTESHIALAVREGQLRASLRPLWVRKNRFVLPRAHPARTHRRARARGGWPFGAGCLAVAARNWHAHRFARAHARRGNDPRKTTASWRFDVHRCRSIQAASSAGGSAPITRSISRPPRNSTRVGMLRMSYSAASAGCSSVLTLAKRRRVP